MNNQSDSDMRETAARICRDYLTGAWKNITADEIQFKRISGGLSNFLYHVALPEAPPKPSVSAMVSAMDSSSQHSTDSRGRSPSLVSGMRGSFSRQSSFSQQSCSEPSQVLLRIYGQIHGEQAFEAVITESVIFTLLSERKLGPKLHGVFPGGRIEQFIPARPLLTSELSDPILSVKIAEKMAAIHSMDVPLSKEPDWIWKTINTWFKSVETTLQTIHSDNESDQKNIEKLRSFNLKKEIKWLREFISTVNSPVMFCHNDMQEGNILMREGCAGGLEDSFQSLTHQDDSFDAQFSELHPFENESKTFNENEILIHNDEACDFTQQMALKSNDICESDHFFERSQINNFKLNDNGSSKENNHTPDKKIIESMDFDNTRDSVLTHSSHSCNDTCDRDLVLIDFEYCSYNYRGFDLANHFIEWSYDYTNKEEPYFYDKVDQYPTLEQQKRFISAYLQNGSGFYNGRVSPAHSNKSGSNSGVSSTDMIGTDEPSSEEISQLLEEVKAFSLASHLFWALWAAVNAPLSQIPFGYWDYAVSRMERYFAAKQLIIPVKSSLKRKLIDIE